MADSEFGEGNHVELREKTFVYDMKWNLCDQIDVYKTFYRPRAKTHSYRQGKTKRMYIYRTRRGGRIQRSR